MIRSSDQFLPLDPLINIHQEPAGKVALKEDPFQVVQPLFRRHPMPDISRLVQVSVQHDNGKSQNEDRVSRENITGIAFFVAISEGVHETFDLLGLTCN